jgi:hypothetical protein
MKPNPLSLTSRLIVPFIGAMPSPLTLVDASAVIDDRPSLFESTSDGAFDLSSFAQELARLVRTLEDPKL